MENDYELLDLTVKEWWYVHDYVRDKDTRKEHDKDFMTRVMSGVLKGGSILVNEEELWWIDRLLPSALKDGTLMSGQNILLKVMSLILKIRSNENYDDSISSDDSSEDYRTRDGADETVAS
jgi:hypothetical protein